MFPVRRGVLHDDGGAARDGKCGGTGMPGGYPKAIAVSEPVHFGLAAADVPIAARLSRRSSWVAKRLIDCMLAVIGLIVSAPLIGCCVVLIKWIDPGPALFRHRRIGRSGKTIEILKLRSMYLEAETMLERCLARDPQARAAWCEKFKLEDDPRVLPIIGKLMRRWSLDELPQMWNVLRGEMSLVGPRPLPEYHLDALPERFRRARQQLLPGLTGAWQIAVRSNGDVKALVQLDSYYLQNWSVALDLYILCATIPALIRGNGAR
jgi:lipopolysaccharide/colanic/teichoic acid biosynthesis glycosyltransferase